MLQFGDELFAGFFPRCGIDLVGVGSNDSSLDFLAPRRLDGGGIYSLPPGTGFMMLGDAHWTNYAENRDFFYAKRLSSKRG